MEELGITWEMFGWKRKSVWEAGRVLGIVVLGGGVSCFLYIFFLLLIKFG